MRVARRAFPLNPSPVWGGAGVGVRAKGPRAAKPRTPLSNLSPTRGERQCLRHGLAPREPGLRGPRKVLLCGAPLRRGDGLMGPSILVVDNYDSFTWNLVHYLREIGAEVEVARNDTLSAAEAVAARPGAVLISPGPGIPDGAGISLDLVAACAEARLPLLGVCLGHQAIAQHFGGRIARAPRIMHGKVSAIEHDGSGVFAGLPSPFAATRYHSLTVPAESLPASLIVNARAEDGTIQGFRHASLPIHGVQFHPESIASEHGHVLLANFLELATLAAAA